MVSFSPALISEQGMVRSSIMYIRHVQCFHFSFQATNHQCQCCQFRTWMSLTRLEKKKMSSAHRIVSHTWFQMTGETLSTSHIASKSLWLWGFNILEKRALHLSWIQRRFLLPPVRQKWNLHHPKSEAIPAKSQAVVLPDSFLWAKREASRWKKQDPTFSQGVYEYSNSLTLDIHLNGINKESEPCVLGALVFREDHLLRVQCQDSSGYTGTNDFWKSVLWRSAQSTVCFEQGVSRPLTSTCVLIAAIWIILFKLPLKL